MRVCTDLNKRRNFSEPCSSLSGIPELPQVHKGHFESQAIVTYIRKYRNSVFNDENGILKENDLMVTSNDLQGQMLLNRMTFILHSLQ